MAHSHPPKTRTHAYTYTYTRCVTQPNKHFKTANNTQNVRFPYLVLCVQHTLVSEIRELIYSEDRTRYDELVYSRVRDEVYNRDTYLSDRDRHRVSTPSNSRYIRYCCCCSIYWRFEYRLQDSFFFSALGISTYC